MIDKKEREEGEKKKERRETKGRISWSGRVPLTCAFPYTGKASSFSRYTL